MTDALTKQPDSSSESPRAVRSMKSGDMLEWIAQGELASYRYQLNAGAFYGLMIGGLGVVIAAVFLGVRSRMSLPIHWSGVVILAFAWVWLWHLAIRWGVHSVRAFVALRGDDMLVAKGSSGYLVPLERITSGTVDASSMRVTRFVTELPIVLDGRVHRVHLTGFLSSIRNIEELMGVILERMAAQSVQEGVSDSDDSTSV